MPNRLEAHVAHMPNVQKALIHILNVYLFNGPLKVNIEIPTKYNYLRLTICVK